MVGHKDTLFLDGDKLYHHSDTVKYYFIS